MTQTQVGLPRSRENSQNRFSVLSNNTLSLISEKIIFYLSSPVCAPPPDPRKTVVDIWWLSTTLNEDVQRGPAIDPPTLYRLLSPGIKGKLNLPISQKIPAKPQISLPCAELRPPGRGALVVTAGPVGTVSVGGLDGSRWACVLCGPAFAVTPCLLSPPQQGSGAHRPAYLSPSALQPSAFPQTSHLYPTCCQLLWWLRLLRTQSSCKEASSSNLSWDLISRHATLTTRHQPGFCEPHLPWEYI